MEVISLAVKRYKDLCEGAYCGAYCLGRWHGADGPQGPFVMLLCIYNQFLKSSVSDLSRFAQGKASSAPNSSAASHFSTSLPPAMPSHSPRPFALILMGPAPTAQGA